MESYCAEVTELAPSLMFIGRLGNVREVFLVAEGSLISKVEAIEAPLVLLAAYYSYNMSYPPGLVTFYTFLEYIILEKKPQILGGTLSNFITQLSVIN